MKDLDADKVTVASWVSDFSDQLYSWALHKTGDQVISEDLVQETFLSAYQSIKSFRGQSQPKTWLFQILKNKIIDHYRKASKQKWVRSLSDTFLSVFDTNGNWQATGTESQWDNEVHLLDDRAFIDTLGVCMEDLPDSWRMAVELKYLSAKKAREICQELDITTSNYWQIIHRAKVQLKKCLDQQWFDKN